jgi:hypothetical protein
MAGMSSPLESISRQVARLPADHRAIVEEGLASVAALMIDAPSETAAEVAENLQKLDSSEDPQGDALEARNLLRIFEDWQRVRDQSITTGDLAKLGVNRQVLEQHRKAHKLLALEVPFKRELLYPAWQFDQTGHPLDGIGRLMDAAQEARLSPTDLHFFMSRVPPGGSAPSDQLAAGDVDEIVAAVRAAGAQGG